MALNLTPGNTDDSKCIYALRRDLIGKSLGYRGYITQ
ncbi:MAG: transposase [cyanobacterium endosymbiont of Epithemia adnata isolate EadnSB Bon19]